MITLTNVSAGYGAGNVLENISLEIIGNISIVGPNGCGKTTLLKVMAGLLPHKGDVEIGGKPISEMKRQEVAGKIAMLSQQPAIYFDYTVFDAVMMGRYIHIKNRLMVSPSNADKEAVFRSLVAVGLLELKNRSISKLSGGQLQRVFLARALAQEPCIILLDEPTNHLDLKCQVEIVNYLKIWSKEGNRAVVGVLHDINLAMSLADEIVVMKDGKIHTTGKAADIVAGGVLNQVYQMDVAAHMQNSLKKWVLGTQSIG
ncbi:MAG: ABC transporter ATP-binding protein [Defluviitaleaceae bacterium]|nr:ABC transporter ATP-binding protein [Defluviitaleaceae bacterium]